DLATHELTDEQALEVADALDRVAIELDDQVAGANAGRGGWGAIQQLHDLQPAAAPEVMCQRGGEWPRPAHDAQVRAPHAPVAHERAEDPAGGRVDRDGEAEP